MHHVVLLAGSKEAFADVSFKGSAKADDRQQPSSPNVKDIPPTSSSKVESNTEIRHLFPETWLWIIHRVPMSMTFSIFQIVHTYARLYVVEVFESFV